MSVDCTSGLTLRVVISSGTVELHTDTPAQLEFVSFITTVKDSIACGTTEPPLRVAIVYKRTADHRFLGEPLRVDFIGTN